MWLRGVGVRSLGHSSQKFWSGIAFWNLPIEISLNTKNPYWHLKINPNLIRSTVFSKNGCRGTKKQVVEVWMSYMVFNISPNACVYYASKTVNVLKSNLLSCTVHCRATKYLWCVSLYLCAGETIISFFCCNFVLLVKQILVVCIVVLLYLCAGASPLHFDRSPSGKAFQPARTFKYVIFFEEAMLPRILWKCQ